MYCSHHRLFFTNHELILLFTTKQPFFLCENPSDYDNSHSPQTPWILAERKCHLVVNNRNQLWVWENHVEILITKPTSRIDGAQLQRNGVSVTSIRTTSVFKIYRVLVGTVTFTPPGHLTKRHDFFLRVA